MRSFVGIWLCLLVFLFSLSWCLNLAKLCTSDFEAPYKSEVVRAAGAVIPIVGAIVGPMDIGDE